MALLGTSNKTNHTMKTLAFLLLSSIVALSSLAKTSPVVLSNERVRYAVEYDTVRAGLLGKTGDEMGDVEALQAIVVHFSRAFKRTESRLQKLETDIAAIKKKSRCRRNKYRRRRKADHRSREAVQNTR